ncbi:MAG: hypothetical protein HY289_02025 [Planctomycetes bacterium]|nr:hypothetical protein [Planctomycetota bacterium]
MQFLETIVRMFDGCVGLLEVLTILFDAAAIYLGFNTYQKHQRAVTKSVHDHGKSAHKKPHWWPAAVLIVFALAFTTLTICKWTIVTR